MGGTIPSSLPPFVPALLLPSFLPSSPFPTSAPPSCYIEHHTSNELPKPSDTIRDTGHRSHDFGAPVMPAPRGNISVMQPANYKITLSAANVTRMAAESRMQHDESKSCT
ncbi:hypothetical protein VDGL01_09936 [Verticillium dahliae]